MFRAVAAALLVAAAPAAAVETDSQLWLQTAAQVPFGGAMHGFGGLYLRYSDDVTRLGTRYLFGGVGWELKEDVELELGYANLRTRSGAGFEYENRLFQQLSYPVVEGRRGFVEARSRLEQRFYSDGGGSRLRFRQRMEVVVPFGDPAGPGFKTSGELFMTLVGTNDVNDAEFDQVRGFVGVVVPAGPLEFDIGYQAQRRDEPDRRNDVLFIGVDIGL